MIIVGNVMEEIADNYLTHIDNDFKNCISHGILVANLSYELALRLGLSKEEAYRIKCAGMVHDIGKLKLTEYLYGRNSRALSITEIKYMRTHSKIGYDCIEKMGFPEDIALMVLRHHECMDGSGYPDNLKGDEIPYGARIIRVVDAFAALISDRPYRKAFDYETAMLIMIDEINTFDMWVFLQFQRFIHEPEAVQIIKNSEINLDDLDIRGILKVNG